jgi:putative hemolysin
MQDNIFVRILFLIFLIAVNALFAASEIAIISLNDGKIKKLAEEGNKKAKQIAKLVSEPSKFLATIQVGVTISGFLASAVAAEGFSGRVTKLLHPLVDKYVSEHVLAVIVLVVITCILSYFTLVFGELVPKRFAMQHCEGVSMAVIGFLTVFEKIARPFVKFLTASTNGVIRLFGGDPNETSENVTEEEIRMMVDLGEEKGTIEVGEKEMIENVFDFNNITAAEVMTHRKDIVGISKDATLDEILELMEEEKYTRFPVYEEDIDNIIGMLHSKDVIKYLNEKNKSSFKIDDIIRPIYFVPDSKMIDDIFRELQKNKMYMAAVVDEYGGTAGILTIEDLMEQLVGNIFDEYDAEEPVDFVKIDENTQLVDGTVNLIEVEKKFDKKLPDDEYDTLGGFIMGHLGFVPEEGDRPQFEYNGLLFKVEEVVEKRITKVKICVTGEEADELDKED